jgi:hypothetical protein
MTDLVFRTRNICDQMERYGGALYNEWLCDIAELLTDINDDLQHARDPALISETINKLQDRINDWWRDDLG